MPESHDELPDVLPGNPWPLFQQWYDAAHDARAAPHPNAMVLATVDEQARPSSRVVLCKIIEHDPGYIVFFTNYESRKGRELTANPHAAVTFHWDALGRQVRIEGIVTRSPDAESDAYFASRPVESRIGAWASRQSKPLASRDVLLEQVAETMTRLDIPVGDVLEGRADVPRPPFWGGFRLWAASIELWISAEQRLHDRARWTRSLTPNNGGFAPGPWEAVRLQP